MTVTSVEVRLDQDVLAHVAADRHLADWRGIVAYCNICFDNCFIVKEIRAISEIDGMKISMPDRKISVRFKCGHKNAFDHQYCCVCGKKKEQDDIVSEHIRRYVDVCHPITQKFRRHINEKVILAIHEQIRVDLHVSKSTGKS